ncbi:MAG TPA: oligosaccharide flippase family protein [Thermoanaerobaculia bacterium]|nr:oligosaccharide flippase family protein [Thermoanaerobaculia bacterium]
MPISSLNNLFPARGSFLSSIASVAGGTALAQGIAFAAAPVLTRLYTPADFGVFAVFTSIVILTLPLACGRYQVAIPLARTDGQARDLVALSLSLLLVMTIVAAVVLVFAGEALVRTFHAPALLPYLWLVPVSLAGAALLDIGTYAATRQKRFTELFRSKVAQAASMVGIQLLLARVGAGGLMAGDAASRIAAGSLLNWRTFAPAAVRQATLPGMRAAASEHRRFPLLYVWSSLLNVANVQMLPLLISSAFGTAVAGQFSLANRVVFLPLTLIGQAVASPFYQRAAAMYRERPEELPSFVFRTQKMLLLCAVVPTLILIAFGPQLFAFVFGRAWTEAGRYAQIFVSVLLAELVFSPVSQLFNIFNKQHVHLIWSALLCTSTFFAVRLAVPYGATAAVIALTAVNLVAYGIGLLLIAVWMHPLRTGGRP